MKLNDSARFSTICIHAGQEPDPATGAIITPIYQTSTYVQDGLGQPHAGFEYGRTQNPTRMALERNIAAIEAGTAAFAFASGMAAIDAVLTRLESGDHVLVSDNTYGGTFRLFERVRRKFGLDFTYVDTSKPELVGPAIKPNTKYLFIETPTNPMLHITDIAAVSEIAHARNVRVVVDNTFASPYIQQPLTLGADMVLHSTTKFLNGHSDSVGGVVILKHQDDVEWFKFVQNAAGAILGPMDSWLILRGTKTLTVRMERTNTNSQVIAEFLAGHKKVQRTIYPGLTSHPHHALAKRQMRGFGGLISFDVGSLDAAKSVLNNLKLMALAESLGGVETLISHPAIMTHASVPPERRAMLGITDGLIRISVGIEDVEDLQADLAQALATV
ncbi:MAG: cystathionine gamma-synthase [Acidobacteriota bacterium]|nr:cystathionine gamma-synthase [Acidobacteriota bacterium]MDP3719583.1 cystathionine gamma-synthase [Acidobacteriota bacterium]